MKRQLLLGAAIVLMLTSCGTEVADVYIINACAKPLRVILHYSPLIPGGDTDQVHADVSRGAATKIGTFGKENLRDARLEVFRSATWRQPLAHRDYRHEPPRLQRVGGEEVYLLTIPLGAC